ncbi:MAG TPA: hypothetical protein VKB57_23725 [Acidimicrobiales bacterium]|nr:hypothetical protein [Acidimicrobiales bacterium]
MTDEPERWIVPTNFGKFQHRDAWRSRMPTWICDYLEQDGRDDYRSLTMAQRGVLACIRREYARSRGRLRWSAGGLSARFGSRVTERQLIALSDAGFIQVVASRPAGIPASTEVVLRTTNNAPARAREAGGVRAGADKKNTPAPCPECGVGGGRHLDDCAAAPPPGKHVEDQLADRLLASLNGNGDDEELF